MKEAKLRFIFIAPCVGEAFFDPVKKGAADATKLMNAECVFDGTADVNINQQIDLIREATMNGYDGIAVSLVHSTAFNQVVEESLKAGIPIVAFNVDSGDPGNRRLSAVCQNLRYAGQVLGAKAADSIAQDSHVLITIHSDGISALEDRLQGMKDALSVKNITTQVIVTGITPHGAAEKIERALRANPRTQTILCTGQADTEGAGLAAEQYFSSDRRYIAGFDLSREILRLIEDGVIAFTIDQQPYVQGFYPVIQLAQYCRYGIMPSNIDAGATVIARSEVADVLGLTTLGYR